VLLYFLFVSANAVNEGSGPFPDDIVGVVQLAEQQTGCCGFDSRSCLRRDSSMAEHWTRDPEWTVNPFDEADYFIKKFFESKINKTGFSFWVQIYSDPL